MKRYNEVRLIDELGRIVLPIAARNDIGWSCKTPVVVFADLERGELTLRKYTETCVFCNHADSLIAFHEKCVCQRCCAELIGQMQL